MLALLSLALAAPDEETEEKAGEEAAEEKSEPEGPTEVTVGMHINDIMAIDLRTHSFMVDGYIWFRWKGDKDPVTSMEFINPYELWGHMEEANYEEPEELEDGTMYQVLRFQGGFSQKLPLYDYPFDKQVLKVVFEDSVDDTAGLHYKLDAVSLNPNMTLPGFTIGKPALVVSDYTHPTTFGDPRHTAPSTYSRATLEIPISRPVFAYAVKLLLPILCAAVSAALMFLLSPRWVDSRTSIGITSLLTIVALQITSNEDLPDVGYLTMLDKLYVCAYLLVILSLVVVIWSTRLVEGDNESKAAALDRRALVVLYAGFFVTVGWLIMGSL